MPLLLSQVSGQFDLRISDDLRLTVDSTTRTWHFYADGTCALKFYSSEVSEHQMG